MSDLAVISHMERWVGGLRHLELSLEVVLKHLSLTYLSVLLVHHRLLSLYVETVVVAQTV